MFSLFIYKLTTQSYFALIRFAALFNSKAKLWVDGRKNLFEDLTSKLEKCPKKGPLIWFHCASVGEFEQGRPLMEAIRKKNPDARLLLSFFSPSGYELRKNTDVADIICYLPIDSKKNAVEWFELIRPAAVFFVKYEFWYFILKEANKRKTPLYLVSAVFREDQAFFKSYGALHRKMLGFFTRIFVQNEASAALLKTEGFENVSITGDTRFDRVIDIRNNHIELPLIKAFADTKKVLVCGSSWPADENIILEFWWKYLKNKDWKLIIAPHELHEAAIEKLKKQFQKTAPAICYSELSGTETPEDYSVLIIDNIGMLSRVYRYAAAAYIGGGFGKGIHNSLEAAVYEIPVYFGPKNNKFAEAQELKNLNIAFEINNADELISFFDHCNYDKIKESAAHYIRKHRGATEKILLEANF